MNTTLVSGLVSTDGRQRSVRGLGLPNLVRMYSARERHARRFLIQGIKECSGEGLPESHLPLWHFYGTQAQERINLKRPALEGRRFWEFYPDGAYPEDDATAASIPGIQARHVFEARLSRLAFLDTLLDISHEVIADCERGFGDWDYLEFLSAIYPYSARAWEPFTIAELTQQAAVNLHSRLYQNSPMPCQTVADRMILQFAVEVHQCNMFSLGIEMPHYPLDEVLIDNSDYLLLFDPALDGIESDAVAVESNLDISGPFAWFGIETYESVIAETLEN